MAAGVEIRSGLHHITGSKNGRACRRGSAKKAAFAAVLFPK